MQGFTEADVRDPPKPMEWTWDGVPVVSRDTYKTLFTYQRIVGNEERVCMRGSRWCLKWRYSFSHAHSIGGWAHEVCERYIRRFYPKKIFFDNDDLWPILRKVNEKFPMAARTFRAVENRLRVPPASRYHDEYPIMFKGKVRYLTRQQYQMCLAIYKQTEKMEMLENEKTCH